MAVFKVYKNDNYTVMSNYHFKERGMSLKAKGLLSLMLSLPEDWDYSIGGLVAICKENETAIKNALSELKEFGYVEVIKLTPKQTQSGRFEYIYNIYETPKQEDKKQGVENLPLENLPIENIPLYKNTNNKNTNNKVSKEVSKNATSEGKNKTSLPRKSYDEIIDEYTDNEELKLELKAFLQVVRLKNMTLTNRALILLLDDLDNLAAEDYHKIRIIQKALVNGRTSFEALSEKEEESLFRMHKWKQKYGKDFLKNALDSD